MARSLAVINNTGHEVYFTIFGNRANAPDPVFPGSLEIMPAGTTVFYPHAGAVPIPGLHANDRINGAEIYAFLPFCGDFRPIQVGEPGSGWPDRGAFFLHKNDGYAGMDIKLTAIWIPATAPDFRAVLTIS